MKKFFLGLGFALLAGCASIGAVPAKSLDQQIAYAHGAVTAVRVSAAQALSAGTLPVGDAVKVEALSESVMSALGVAQVAEGTGDIATAQGKLAVALTALTEVQQLLIAKGVR